MIFHFKKNYYCIALLYLSSMPNVRREEERTREEKKEKKKSL